MREYENVSSVKEAYIEHDFRSRLCDRHELMESARRICFEIFQAYGILVIPKETIFYVLGGSPSV